MPILHFNFLMYDWMDLLLEVIKLLIVGHSVWGFGQDQVELGPGPRGLLSSTHTGDVPVSTGMLPLQLICSWVLS